MTASIPQRPGQAAAWRHIDVLVVAASVAVASLGALMIYSATRGAEPPYDSFWLRRQAVFVAAGVVAMLVVALIDYRKYRDFAPLIYVGAISLLVLVISPIGSASKGTQAWFQFGVFQLQPSEFTKLAVIVLLATMLAGYNGEIDLGRLGRALGIAGLPLGLILLQPDLGTALVVGAVAIGMLVVAGARPKHLAAVALVGAFAVVGVVNSDALAEYQRDRLTAFLSPEADVQGSTWNLNQSQIAIGAGGMTGRGLFQGTQTRLDIVPEQHTDFIFTAVGEELGFLGSASLLALFSVLVWRTWRSAQLARDVYGSLVCVGVLSMFVFQIFQNVGMTMGIMPITGIPLPFMSYGGSNTLTAFMAMGLVLNVHMRRFV